MQIFYKAFSVFVFCVVMGYCITISGCANIVPPSGGAKDTLAPVLVKSLPADSSVSVKPKRIVLEFDEYIQIENVQENLIVSPVMQQNPVVNHKLKTITINIKDTLEANTTYSFDFGNAIKDVNESNVFKNFTYVFSTGTTIANGTLSGNVVIANTGKTDSTLIVALHRNLNDTSVIKNKPRYYTKIDGSGNFNFKNLPNETFNVFVLENDYTKRYDDTTKMFAFLNETVTVGDSVSNIKLFAYREAEPKPITTPATSKPNAKNEDDKRLKYSANLQTALNFNDTLTLTFNRPLKSADNNKLRLTDTAYNTITDYKIIPDSNKLFVIHNWQLGATYKFIIYKDAVADSADVALTKSDTLNVIIKSERDYGSVKLRFMNIDLSRNPVLQMVSNGEIVMAEPLTANIFERKLFNPGEYEMRILWDDNKNGVWDAGNYKEKRQPEKVTRIVKPLNIRANWDNESDITL